ncbi:MAG: 16S rRNA (uracil(1498)-N(3))-methyltransferase [Rhodothermales bacterium]
MTTTYYIPPDHISGQLVQLPTEEARHAIQVLRHQVGDVIVGVDGVGGWYQIELTETSKKHVAGQIVEQKREMGESTLRLTMAVGLLKNQKRFEVFVEKACELGVSRIIPLRSRRTEKPSVRKDRLEKILIAAMKQCGRSRLVTVDDVMSFDQMISLNGFGNKLICHEQISPDNSLLQALPEKSVGGMQDDLLIAIGPEGGFSSEEIESAEGAGFSVVSLGSRRLRAETAAITACAGVMLRLDG